MNEDELLTLNYRKPTKPYSYYEEELIFKAWDRSWCIEGVKISGYIKDGKVPEGVFGLVNEIRNDGRVNVKWSDGRSIGYDINYLSGLIGTSKMKVLKVLE
jgi:hypothetical protein